MGRKSGASIQRRFTPAGDLRFLVRWREIIQGQITETSKSFVAESDAESFRLKCRSKLTAARSMASLMDVDARGPGDCTRLIEEFVALKRSTGKQGSQHPYATKYTLIKIFSSCGWKQTTDIPADAFTRIETLYGPERRCSVHKGKNILKDFVRWVRTKYLVEESFLVKRVPRHKAERYYVWTDEEKEMIIQALKAPMRVVSQVPSRCGSHEVRGKIAAENDFHIRRALLPVILIQLMWALRPKEAGQVRVRDWTSRNRFLMLPAKITKTGVSRGFVIDRGSAKMIDDLIEGREPDEPIFTTMRGVAWKTANQTFYFRLLLRRLGLRGSLYSCRHYAITTLLELMPGEMRKIMRISGHETMEEFDKYVVEKENRSSMVPPAYEVEFDRSMGQVALPPPSVAEERLASDRESLSAPISPTKRRASV